MKQALHCVKTTLGKTNSLCLRCRRPVRRFDQRCNAFDFDKTEYGRRHLEAAIASQQKALRK